MNWQAIGALGELLGGVVVLASLAFLAIQIRRNTQTIRMSAAEESNRSFSSYAALFTQPGVSRIYRIGLASPDELDDDELITFNAVISTFFNFLSYAHRVRSSGVPNLWSNERALATTAIYILRQPGGQRWWGRFRVAYDDDFQRYTGSLIDAAAAKRVPTEVS